eukprot:m.82510 g.82510  ORF g.82510 m.82510 type:complete len:453 (-) comp13410_c0_seq1:257-1615(-)
MPCSDAARCCTHRRHSPSTATSLCGWASGRCEPFDSLSPSAEGSPHLDFSLWWLFLSVSFLPCLVFATTGLLCWQLVSAPRMLVAHPDLMDSFCTSGQRFCLLYNIGPLRSFLYYSLGATLIFATGTWYGNASVYGTYVPWWLSRYPLFILWQTAVGYVAMLLTWVGIYNALGAWISSNFPGYTESIWANAIIFLLGVKLVVLTQTWTCLAYIYPRGFFDSPPLSSRDSLWEHAMQMLRAAVSYFGQIAMWVTSWNLMLNYFGDGGVYVYTSLMWTGFGMALLLGTRTFLLSAWLDLLDDDYDDDEPGTILFYIKVTLSITGQFMNNTGVWNILETYLAPNGSVVINSGDAVPITTLTSAWVMVAIGMVMLALAGIVQVGCGVNPLNMDDLREQRRRMSVARAGRATAQNIFSTVRRSRAATRRRATLFTRPQAALLTERLLMVHEDDETVA